MDAPAAGTPWRTLMPELPLDPPDDDEPDPPQFCPGCGLPIGEPHGCDCERVEIRVLIRLEDA